ncbi:hypothetical protein [Thiorhodovibrio frisius]|uniref:Uncharacterized protein n=1 Tax=Thiorhodovibrio frisius TaxID=631362 RepID=H8YVU1_9GAMM|nr:hypothetical protein [Thiorhodovibrio frisius]EIC24031.1 hypothetical protein Thi970DRAFT_00172 [Thiorhodovibrio frisius]WPL23105.1 hypothetical protein Thiofri_03287 [Thiorhodovibrio frisius]
MTDHLLPADLAQTDLLQAYQQCRADLQSLSDGRQGSGAGWATFTARQLQVVQTIAPDPATLASQLATVPFDPATGFGWTLWQSERGVQACSLATLLADLSAQSVPLDGEFATATASLALQYRTGAWHLTQLIEVAPGEDVAVLACDQAYLARPPAAGHLQYRVYWAQDSNHGYRPRWSRLLHLEAQADKAA